MTADLGPRYDAFVVRLWRDTASGRLLRAEVEHVATGGVARAADVSAGWIERQIEACLAEHLSGESPTPEGAGERGPTGAPEEGIAG